MSGKFADQAIIERVRKRGGIIATLDSELKNKIKSLGGSVMSFSSDKIVLESQQNLTVEEHKIKQMGNLELTSSAFSDGGEIPRQFGYKNGNEEPPLTISGTPEGNKIISTSHG